MSWMKTACAGIRRANSTAGDGEMRCATQTTPQAPACISDGGPPRISTAALLKLAQWCQARRGELTGESPCPTPVVPESPPAPATNHAGQFADPTLVGPAPGPASGSLGGAQPDRCPEPPHAEGGQP